MAIRTMTVASGDGKWSPGWHQVTVTDAKPGVWEGPERKKKYIVTEVKVGFQNINEKYLCKVFLFSQKRITLDYISGPFEYLEIDWKFKEVSKNKTEVIFFCNFKFSSIILRLFTSFFLEGAIKKMVDAFEKRLNSI